jgi:hypothetical protein
VYWEVGTPKRLLMDSIEKTIEFIRKNIKKTNLYITNYKYRRLIENNGFKKIDYDSAIVDSMFFDIDKGNFYENTMKFHRWLEKNNILHRINCSGNGFHVIVYIKPLLGPNKKSVLYNAMKYLNEKLRLNAEEKTFGDISRLRRIENTFNFKANVYCIPLNKETINLSWEEIKRLADEPQDIYFFGNELLDISNFSDMPNNGFLESNFSNENRYYNKNFPANILSVKDIEFPPCIKNILNKKEKNFTDRFILISFLKNAGVKYSETIEFLKKELSTVRLHHNKWLESDFQHCMRERQVEYIFSKNFLFPSCETIKKMGYCNLYGICKQRQKLSI